MDKEGYSAQVEAAAEKIHAHARLTLGEVPSDIRPLLARLEWDEKMEQMQREMQRQAQPRYVPKRRR